MTTTTAAASPEWKNMFGVCASVADDFGFDALWLRLAFAVALLWNPLAVIGAYAVLGAVVVISRLVAPDRRRGSVAREDVVMG